MKTPLAAFRFISVMMRTGIGDVLLNGLAERLLPLLVDQSLEQQHSVLVKGANLFLGHGLRVCHLSS